MRYDLGEITKGLTPVTEWKSGVQDGKYIVKRDRRQDAVYSGLPYIIHKDFSRLVRLARLWNKAMRTHQGTTYLHMLSWQCETLYYRVYGSVCYFGDVPANLISKY